MAQLWSFSLVGDSNIKRNISKTNARACPQMATSQLLYCQKLELLDEVLHRVRKETNACVVSCVTNFLTSSEEDSMVSKRVEPVLDDFVGALTDACGRSPDVAFLVSPPMYRKSPLWYREGLPEILTKFSAAFKQRPDNLHLLPSFPTPELEADGVHLNAYSGLEFMIHLFDSSVSLLEDLAKPCDERIPVTNEATRVLEDRVMVLEQDHRRLNRDVELRTAYDAELHDYHENAGNEAFLMITGCPKIIGETTRDWQVKAKKDVALVLKELMGRDVPIEYISNATGPRPDAPVRYNVKLFSTEVSKEIRDKFGSFFGSGRDERPTVFKPYEIRNLVTQATRVRIAILQVIGRRYRESNPGAKVQIISHQPRPVLKITPAQGASSRKVLNFNFVEAVKKYPTNFNKTDLDFILAKVGHKQKGRLRSLFVCLSDDMMVSRRSRPQRQDGAVPPNDAAADDDTDSTLTTDDHMEVSTELIPQLPVVPQPSGSRGHGSGSGSRTSGSRAGKRGPPTPPTPQPEKSSRN